MAVYSMHCLRRLLLYCVSVVAFLIVIFTSMNLLEDVFPKYVYSLDSKKVQSRASYKHAMSEETVKTLFISNTLKTPTINKIMHNTFLERWTTNSNRWLEEITTQRKEMFTTKAATNMKTVDINHEARIAYPLTSFGSPYVLNNDKICEGANNLTYIVLVHTATDHFYRRSVIRETWANKNILTNQSLRVVFLLGRPQGNTKIQAAIEHESYMHKDIVQGDFSDTYHNLTHKGVLGYRWISEYCLQAKFVIKVDDDVFVNIFKLMLGTSINYHADKRKLRCYIRMNGTSPIQRKTGKWKVDDSEFKNMTYFPVTYCNGFFVFMTTDIIKELYEASKVTPFFWIDDVYIFGLLPAKVGSIRFESMEGLTLSEEDSLKCFKMNKPCNYLAATAVAKGNMETLWYGSIKQYHSLAKAYAKPQLFSI
ncbi:hypothetical protein CHS0354_030696 [Potamilus streckersoni]|uniref:Hexosyltransferase n=1 Tax=Potamilus streckersoni TaxID=2493646 RepID=A0AAE0VQP4_9BIVA|nr:hypothetical protein CHS0354_030696 [Potamilus streckersoni]